MKTGFLIQASSAIPTTETFSVIVGGSKLAISID